jgi:hypothetical protein
MSIEPFRIPTDNRHWHPGLLSGGFSAIVSSSPGRFCRRDYSLYVWTRLRLVFCEG